MRTYDKFYINGQWVEPSGKGTSEVINPATGEVSATVPYGNAEDVDTAVRAARNAFDSWSRTSAAERAEYLRKLAAEGEKRSADLTQTIIGPGGLRCSKYHVSGPPVARPAPRAGRKDSAC